MKSLRVVIFGNVQGVFFRALMKEQADRLKIAGWVRNNPDGTVEAVVEGENGMVDEMVKWCYKGNPKATVEKISLAKETVQGIIGFEIQ